MTRNTALDWAPDVRLTRLAPGLVATDLTADLRDDDLRQSILDRTPLELFADSGEIAGRRCSWRAQLPRLLLAGYWPPMAVGPPSSPTSEASENADVALFRGRRRCDIIVSNGAAFLYVSGDVAIVTVI